MEIDFANLQLQYQKYKDKIDVNLQKVLNKSNYILGEEVATLEKELENFINLFYFKTVLLFLLQKDYNIYQSLRFYKSLKID